ncbi:MAG: SDR family oxidoreductase [Pseudomonadota bacterium]
MEFKGLEGGAFVAGGSGGIGRGICLALAEAGSDVFFTYRNRREAAEQVAREIEALGGRAAFAPLALEDADATARVVQEARAFLGRLHSVVYAAGPPLTLKLIRKIEPADWARVMNADLNGSFNLVHATLPMLREQGGGNYVAVITTAVERVPVCDIMSAAPKAAVEMLFRGVAKEEGRRNIRANCVGPGWIDAGLGHAVMSEELTQAQVDAIVQTIPLGRVGYAQDIANAVVFLLSPKANYITGQSLAVDGGMQV